MIAAFTITQNRLKLTKKAFRLLRSRAGTEFDHFVFDNNSEDGTQEWLTQQYEAGSIKRLHLGDENYGQNIAANVLLDWIDEGDYEWIVRFDNDTVPRTRRFLQKLIKCAATLRAKGLEPVVAPYTDKLLNQIPTRGTIEKDSIGFECDIVSILGGMCRLHHTSFFDEEDGSRFRFNQFGALGYGEAMEVSRRVANMHASGRSAALVRIPWVHVEHAMGADKQAEMYPEYFQFRKKGVARFVSYGLA